MVTRGQGALRTLMVLGCLMSSLCPAAGEEPEGLSENKIKAVYLYYFATFMDWPPGSLDNDSHEIVIGILGEDPFGSILDDTVRGKMVQRRSLTVKRFQSVQEARQSQILFISPSEQDQLVHILKVLGDAPVLTVGDGRFAALGGQIAFQREEKRVRFEINAEAVKRAGLKMSAQLLKLGRIVGDSSP